MPLDPKLPTSNGVTAATGKFSKVAVGTGLRVKSTMKGPTLSTLGEDRTENVWNVVGQKWRTPSVASQPQTLTSSFAQMAVGGRTMDPSNAPGKSQLSTQYKPNKSQAPSTQLSVRDDNGRAAQWIKTELCVRSPFQRKSFTKGMIITLPFHVANLNEKATLEDKCLGTTLHGPIYSKRRMAIVLWRHDTDMICLPLYSWNGVGISKQPRYLHHEFMEITNVGYGRSYKREGINSVLEAQMVRPLNRKGCVHASGSFRVNYQEDIALVGQLTEQSKNNLIALVGNLIKSSQAEKH